MLPVDLPKAPLAAARALLITLFLAPGFNSSSNSFALALSISFFSAWVTWLLPVSFAVIVGSVSSIAASIFGTIGGGKFLPTPPLISARAEVLSSAVFCSWTIGEASTIFLNILFSAGLNI